MKKFTLLIASLLVVNLAFAETKVVEPRFIVLWELDESKLKSAENALPEQANALLGLLRSGDVENVYFNDKVELNDMKRLKESRIVFFVKASTESEAKSKIDTLPFVQQKLATYEVHPVGYHWVGPF